MMPQFARKKSFSLAPENIALGSFIFFCGLFKKVILADHAAYFSDQVFNLAEKGYAPHLVEAWTGALAYTFQLYFDFSGYSDMAMGLALFFGITIPINFFSPYKALNIVEFWRRWHITLSRFLRDYLYISLGGNRRGKVRRYSNLMTTMLLGGLWHGASWNFVFWGGLHGIYLIINHAWTGFRKSIGFNPRSFLLRSFFPGLITFIAVVFAWVFFRAESFDAAISISKGMLGLNGVVLTQHLEGVLYFLKTWNVQFGSLYGEGTHIRAVDVLLWFIPFFLITFLSPNVLEMAQLYLKQEIFLGFKLGQRVLWKPTQTWAITASVVTIISVIYLISGAEQFLYYQF